MKLLQEPLLHFLLLGAVIFGAYGLLSKRAATEPGKIIVTQGRIEALATAFSRTWQRPPTTSELDGLIRDYIREEVSTREAITLGLDKDDTIIRRRLRQKLEFVSEDIAAQAEPTDEQLRAYLLGHPEAFRVEPRVTFSQVFLSPERRGEHLSRDAAQLLAQLRQGGTDAGTLGDSLLLDHRFDALPVSVIARQFGDQFAATLGELPSGQWHGPVASGYGAHLVFVGAHTEGHLPAFEDIREAVRREWFSTQRLKAIETFYQALLQRYTVTIERPQAAQVMENTQLTRRSP
jgi:hypothetical protein